MRTTFWPSRVVRRLGSSSCSSECPIISTKWNCFSKKEWEQLPGSPTARQVAHSAERQVWILVFHTVDGYSNHWAIVKNATANSSFSSSVNLAFCIICISYKNPNQMFCVGLTGVFHVKQNRVFFFFLSSWRRKVEAFPIWFDQKEIFLVWLPNLKINGPWTLIVTVSGTLPLRKMRGGFPGRCYRIVETKFSISLLILCFRLYGLLYGLLAGASWSIWHTRWWWQ